MKESATGYFFLVVGPSGTGKDSLMDAAKLRLPKDQFIFAKRTVTRPPGMVGEDYESCDPEQFAARKAQGEFLATWQAHGYAYGLARELAAEQARGKHIVANGSRSMVDQINKTVPNLVVIHVTAPIELLAKRLAKRGRETEVEISKRLARQTTTFNKGINVHTVTNDDTLECGVQRFMNVIERVLGSSLTET